MARVFYRSPVTGRFVSRDDAEQERAIQYVRDDLARVSETRRFEDWRTPPPAEEIRPSWWTAEDTERGHVWKDFHGDTPTNLTDFSPPEGATKYRVFLETDVSEEYQRGVAPSDWIDIDEWRPSTDMLRGVRASGFRAIVFDRA